MEKIIVSVGDNVANVFNDPMVAVNVASAIRSFVDGVVEHKHKDDFVLYKVGVFDTTTGEITANTPVKLITGIEIQNKVRKDNEIGNEA